MSFRTFIKLAVLLTFAQSTSAIADPLADARAAMREFYSNPGPEDTLMDPLIAAGFIVVPLVIEAIQNPKMPRRRYAISFLGNEGIGDALPLLISILEDDEEFDYFRGDALVAIYKINRSFGLAHAEKYRDGEDHLGRMAKEVLEETRYVNYRRSLESAKMRRHD